MLPRGTGSEAPGVRTATQPVEAPGASSDVQFSGDSSVLDRSLTTTRTFTDNTGVSDTEDEMASELSVPSGTLV